MQYVCVVCVRRMLGVSSVCLNFIIIIQFLLHTSYQSSAAISFRNFISFLVFLSLNNQKTKTICNLQYAICNLQSAICNLHLRLELNLCRILSVFHCCNCLLANLAQMYVYVYISFKNKINNFILMCYYKQTVHFLPTKLVKKSFPLHCTYFSFVFTIFKFRYFQFFFFWLRACVFFIFCFLLCKN